MSPKGKLCLVPPYHLQMELTEPRVVGKSGFLWRCIASIVHSHEVLREHHTTFQLPAAHVTGVTSVTIGGEAWTDFSFEPNGFLRLFDVCDATITRKTEIVVVYAAGLPSALMDSIKEIIAGRATRALVDTNGVASESAGGVSISYSANWSNGGGAGALQSTDVETLEPSTLREVF